MSSEERKYAQLYDIDTEAPDVYETPDLTDDNSTLPTSPPESSTDEIDHHGVDPDQARAVFLPSTEHESVPGSRISSVRGTYSSSSKWSKRDGAEVNGDELGSEDEREGLERKLTRLRREIAEVKGEVERRNLDRESKGEEKEEDKEGDQVKNADLQSKQKSVKNETTQDKKEWITGEYIDSLDQVLSSVASTAGIEGDSAASKFTKRLALAPPTAPQTTPSIQAPSNTSQSTTYNLTYAPTYNQNYTLSQISSFDSRLSALEVLLGIDALPIPTQVSSDPVLKPVLPTLDILSHQLTTLTTAISSPIALDTLTRRVRALNTETQSLEAARKATASHQVSEETSEGTSTPTQLNPAESIHDPESLTKLNALHALLPTITSLAPLLPPTLDRLRSLRTLHAEAAAASQTLQQVEQRQQTIFEEIKAWKAGLEGLEGKVAKTGERWEENAKVVEDWVKELEGRIESLGMAR